MANRVDISNINTSLLDAVNSVRKGDNTNITINYYYSNLEKNIPSSISVTDFRKDVEMAFLQWELCFNALYTANRFIKGNLTLKFKESSSSEGIKIQISGSKYVEGGKDTISLGSKVFWTTSYSLKTNPLLSAVVYGVGRALGVPTVNNNSPMNLANTKMDYASLSLLKFNNNSLTENGLKNYITLIENILYIYGHINNNNDIIYGCTNSSASNYNNKANRDNGSCLIDKVGPRNLSVFNPKNTVNANFKVIMSKSGYGTLNFKDLSLDKIDTFNS